MTNKESLKLVELAAIHTIVEQSSYKFRWYYLGQSLTSFEVANLLMVNNGQGLDFWLEMINHETMIVN